MIVARTIFRYKTTGEIVADLYCPACGQRTSETLTTDAKVESMKCPFCGKTQKDIEKERSK